MSASLLTAAELRHQALAHRCRLRILVMLRVGELCVGELGEALGLAFSRMSKHLQQPQSAALLKAGKDGCWVFYRLATSGVTGEILACLDKELEGIALSREDAARAAELRARRGIEGCAVAVCHVSSGSGAAEHGTGGMRTEGS